MKSVPLTLGLVAYVDDADFENVSQFKWQALKGPHTHYARGQRTYRGEDGPSQRFAFLMHHLILGRKDGYEIDHINGCGRDNRRENLRFCTRSQNMANSSRAGLRGISKCGNYWGAEIQVNHKRIYLGKYKDPEVAARAYDRAAREYFREFARLNFPSELT